MSITDFYVLLYNTEGFLVAINEIASGAQLIFYPETKTFDESHYLTIQLRERESLYGALDLSNKEVGKPKKKP